MNPVELTQKLVQFDTRNPAPEGKKDHPYEAECAQFLGGLIERHLPRFTVRKVALPDAPNRTNLIVSNGGENPLIYTGHLDTVPLGQTPWLVDPHAGEIDGNKIYGRGTTDMQAGNAAFIAAVGRFKNPPPIEMIFTVGEETGCDGAKYLAGQEGILRPDASVLLVGEPTDAYPLVGHKGALWLNLISKGKTAHGSMPELGENALYGAARIITALKEYAFDVEEHEHMGCPTLSPNTCHAGININSVPDRADIEVDIRAIPGMVHSQILSDLESVLGNNLAEIETLADLPSIYTDPYNTQVERIYRAFEAVTEIRAEPKTATYFTDASVLTPALGGIPTVIFGPGLKEQAHQTDEYCKISDIEKMTEIYTEILDAA